MAGFHDPVKASWLEERNVFAEKNAFAIMMVVADHFMMLNPEISVLHTLRSRGPAPAPGARTGSGSLKARNGVDLLRLEANY